MITDVAKEELSDDCAGKGYGGDVTLGGGRGVGFSVELLEDCVDLADDAIGW